MYLSLSSLTFLLLTRQTFSVDSWAKILWRYPLLSKIGLSSFLLGLNKNKYPTFCIYGFFNMSTQSKYKYKISSSLSAFSLLYPGDAPVVTPAAPPTAPILDYLTPVDDIIHLNVREFTAPGAPRAGQHQTTVLHTDHGPKPINSAYM